MTLTPEDIAGAISGHRFSDAYPYLSDDVRWTLVGGAALSGKDAVVKACEDSATHLASVTTSFHRFRTIVGAQSVVVDSLASYDEGGGDSSVVASCDIYDFADGRVTEITSYNIEVSNDH